jgi:ATP-dependent DNA helicase RecG
MNDLQTNTLVVDAFRLTPTQKKALSKLGIVTVEDLLYNFPSRYSDVAKIKKISTLQEGETVTVYGKIDKLKTKKTFRGKVPMAEGVIEDDTGKLKVMWFNQAYIAKMIANESMVALQGKVTGGTQGIYLANPEIERTKDMPIDASETLFHAGGEQFGVPIYPESRGITSRWFHYNIQKVLSTGIHETLEDPIPQEIREKYHLPSLKTALVWIHAPQKERDAQSARKRFAFEEIFYIQLSRRKAKKEYEQKNSYHIDIDHSKLAEFVDRFPFTLTDGQAQAVQTITDDFGKDKPMLRLLEGDVGSGKTAVAAATSFAVISSHPEGKPFEKLQVAYMAPTEILATQLYESFVKYFSHLPVQVGLITSSGCKKFPSKVDPTIPTDISRSQLLKWVENGEIDILVGTHSLIAKSVKFKNLAYVIIDEQHRFGTNQRAQLVQKVGHSPHFLSMTATPIPRTLALTIYGDLDLTLLDEMPHGRKPVITEIVLPGQREKVYEQIQEQLKAGRQLYVICPRIDEPDPDKATALNLKSVKEESARLKKNVFQEYEIDILHSKMPSKSPTPSVKTKEKVMQKFAEHKTDILVATSVVEVGVNVPNATNIIIEGGERFGLSQLHQLRGRVIRSNDQAYCYVFADTKTQKTLDRLKALKTAKNGFELSELDLQLRGAGELAGKKQWGVSDVGMEAIKNLKMVEAARTEAQILLEEDFTLSKHPLLTHRLAKIETQVHFE